MRKRWLGLVLLGGWLVLQGWLVQAHWINPDEGAHLIDARLAAEGLVPDVHFQARQPLYVYAYVPFFRAFGAHYIAGRLMPVVAMLLSAWVLYAIGRRLWDSRVAWTTAVFYLSAPSILINTAVVKTEPLTMLLTALGILGLVVHLQRGGWWPLAASGAAFAAAYYVRESGLAGLAAANLLILLRYRDGAGQTVRRLLVVWAGFLAVVASVLLWYARWLPLEQVLATESLFPFSKVVTAARVVTGAWQPVTAGPSVGGEAVRVSSQAWSSTTRNVLTAMRLSLPLLVGTVCALWLALTMRRGPRPAAADARQRFGVTVAAAWLGSFALAYAYYTMHRGFFQFYFREFLPPMALLSAWALTQASRSLGWEQRHERVVAVLLAWSALAFGFGLSGQWGLVLATMVAWALGGAILWQAAGVTRRAKTVYAACAAAGTGSLMLAKFTGAGAAVSLRGEWWVIASVVLAVALLRLLAPPLRRLLPVAFALLAFAVSTIWTACHTATILSPAYDSVWSPQTVAQVLQAVRAHSAPDDEVLSGAVIWEFETGRQPFARVTHPLGFDIDFSREDAERLVGQFIRRPPKLVVVDGYTEKTYFQYMPQLRPLIAAAYAPVATVAGSKYPVTVYRRVGEVGGP